MSSHGHLQIIYTLFNALLTRITKHIRFIAMQQRLRLYYIMHIGAVPTRACTNPDCASTPICTFMPKCH